MVKTNLHIYTLTNLMLERPWYQSADCSVCVTSISGAILSRIFIVRTGAGGADVTLLQSENLAVHCNCHTGLGRLCTQHLVMLYCPVSHKTYSTLMLLCWTLNYVPVSRLACVTQHLKSAHRGKVDNGMGPTYFERTSK